MTGRVRQDGGQAAVELALVLPLVAVLLLSLVQMAVVVRDQVMVVHAAREAARAASVDDGDRDTARTAAVASAGVASQRLTVGVRRGGSAADPTITVRVAYRSPTDMPLVGAFLGDAVLAASATMRLEPER